MDTLSIKGIFEVFVNNWVPGIFTFFLGVCYSNIVEKKKLKQKLKNDILEIFIPVFNAGNEISFEVAENACMTERYLSVIQENLSRYLQQRGRK